MRLSRHHSGDVINLYLFSRVITDTSFNLILYMKAERFREGVVSHPPSLPKLAIGNKLPFEGLR